MPTFNIISIDGGMPSIVAVEILAEIEKRTQQDYGRAFLKHTDLFAGTSSGSMTSLLLATAADPATRLPVCRELMSNPGLMAQNTLGGYLQAILGRGSLFATRYMADVLGQKQYLGDKVLGDLSKQVVIVSYQADQTEVGVGGPQNQTWGPRFFHNGPSTDPSLRSPDDHTLAVDVAIASSSSPLLLPFFQGHLDGGLFANNPAMVAAAAAYRQQVPLDQIRLFSLGLGQPVKPLPVKNENWGYYQWLFKPTRFLLLLRVLIQSLRQWGNMPGFMLPEGHFFRFNATSLGKIYVSPFARIRPAVLSQTLTTSEAQLTTAVKWLFDSGWFADDTDMPASNAAQEP